LKQDYSSDYNLLNDLESAKVLLHTHHAMHYAIHTLQSLANDADTIGAIALAVDDSSVAVNFASRYHTAKNPKLPNIATLSEPTV